MADKRIMFQGLSLVYITCLLDRLLVSESTNHTADCILHTTTYAKTHIEINVINAKEKLSEHVCHYNHLYNLLCCDCNVLKRQIIPGRRSGKNVVAVTSDDGLTFTVYPAAVIWSYHKHC